MIPQFLLKHLSVCFVGRFTFCVALQYRPESLCIHLAAEGRDFAATTPHNGRPEEAADHRLRPRRQTARTLLREAAGKATSADKPAISAAVRLLEDHQGFAPPKFPMAHGLGGEKWCEGPVTS